MTAQLHTCTVLIIMICAISFTATARTQGGEIQGDARQSALQQRRMRERHYGTQSDRSMNGSAKTGLPVRTHTTAVSLDLLHQLEEGELLSTIPEESSMCDHSTYIPSAGELSSTVVIPHQARENYGSGTPKLDQKRPMTSSEHNLTDLGAYDRSPVEKHPGSHNPLAIIADIQGESAVTEQRRSQKRFPPLEAIDPLDLETGRVYNNPVYIMEKEKGEHSPIRMSRSSPLSLLRTSLKAKHSPSLVHDSVTEPAQHTPKPSTGERSRLAPTKKPVETTRSSPLAFLRGSKKKQRLRAANTMPPTLDPDGEEPVITSIDDLDNVVEAVPGTSKQKHPTRASARTYDEMKQKLKQKPPSRPISSSHSFMDSPLTASTSARDEALHTHDSAIGLAPRYQLSLSPIPPPLPATSPNSLTSSCSFSIPTVTISTSQPLPLSPKEPFLPSTNTVSFSTPHPSVIPSQQPSQSPKKHTPSHNQPFVQSKSTVKELRERFESMSTPPTSPTPPSPNFQSSSPLHSSTQHHCMDTELDSGRESMVELAITDI